MRLEDQVVGLELAKKLKELGVKQESLFCWNYDGKSNNLFAHDDSEPFEVKKDYLAAAFTVAELGEMLFESRDLRYGYITENIEDEVTCWFKEKIGLSANTEADARAKLLIFLIEEGIIVIEKYARGVTIIKNK